MFTLESQVMAHLAHGSDWWAHPVGISEVRILPERDVVVHLDSHTTLLDGQTFAMSSYAVAHLLPYPEPGVQVNGAPGLRVEAIRAQTCISPESAATVISCFVEPRAPDGSKSYPTGGSRSTRAVTLLCGRSRHCRALSAMTKLSTRV
jgi:hypothetical protein